MKHPLGYCMILACLLCCLACNDPVSTEHDPGAESGECHTASLFVTVVDSVTSVPLREVGISVYSDSAYMFFSYTDYNGELLKEGLSPSHTYQLKAVKAGYAVATVSVTLYSSALYSVMVYLVPD